MGNQQQEILSTVYQISFDTMPVRMGICIQGETIVENSRRISYQELERAVSACSYWVESHLELDSKEAGPYKPKPVALYLESDVGLFIYIAAMLASGIPVGC